jgi:hypothetical protein
MRRLNFKPLTGITSIILFFQCTPQATFHLPASGSSRGQYEQGRAQSHYHASDESISTLRTEVIVAESSLSVVATGNEDISLAASNTALPMAENITSQRGYREDFSGKEQVKIHQVQKAANKKLTGKASDKPPMHKGAWLGFILSLAGLALLLITLSVSSPLIPFTLSLVSFIAAMITSRSAISRIKKNPAEFSGKGLAWTGFIIGLIMLILYLVFIGYVLAFAGAF